MIRKQRVREEPVSLRAAPGAASLQNSGIRPRRFGARVVDHPPRPVGRVLLCRKPIEPAGIEGMADLILGPLVFLLLARLAPIARILSLLIVISHRFRPRHSRESCGKNTFSKNWFHFWGQILAVPK